MDKIDGLGFRACPFFFTTLQWMEEILLQLVSQKHRNYHCWGYTKGCARFPPSTVVAAELCHLQSDRDSIQGPANLAWLPVKAVKFFS